MYSKDLPKKAILPPGVKDILIEDSAKIKYISEGITGVFEKWGYKRIITSLLEYEDILSKGIDTRIKKGLLKFIEQGTGRVVTMRPDITPQIARIVTTRLKDWPMPLRLYYNESVLRSLDHPTSRIEELFQIGAELVGLELPEADAEVIIMAIEALRHLGLRDFKIDIGHVGFLKGLLDSLSIEEEEKTSLMKTITLKDRTGLIELVSGLPIADDFKETLCDIPTLYGGEEVIKKAFEMAEGMNAEISLENLRSIVKFINISGVQEHITIDLSEARGFNYYTGIIFEGFIKGIGKGIVKGGRYDNLLLRYGYQCPAVGFAFDVEGVMAAIEPGPLSGKLAVTDFLIFDTREDKSEAISIARTLRDRGYSVARDIIRRDYGASLNYCKKNRIRFILSIGTKGLPEGETMIEEVVSGKRRKLKIKDLLKGEGLW